MTLKNRTKNGNNYGTTIIGKIDFIFTVIERRITEITQTWNNGIIIRNN